MFETVEMRWFFADVPLDEVCQFRSDTEVQERTDWYSMPCNPLCGIKVREGKLEAKLRVGTLGVRDLSPLVGQLEAYRKWSLEFAADEHPSEDELMAVDWLPVMKRRQLRRFEVDGHRITSTTTRPTNGCEFEMTRLSVQKQTYWTVGFEAVGPPDRIIENLQQVAAQVVQRGGLRQAFAAVNSYGYAHWLYDLRAS